MLAVEAVIDRKAQDVVLLDMHEVTLVTDYFLICTGVSRPHVQAVAEEVEARLAAAGAQPRHREGYVAGSWVVLDYGGLVTHIFQPQAREFYALERLWGDAVTVDIDRERNRPAGRPAHLA